MADRIEQFNEVLPANGTINVPVKYPMVFPQGDVERIDIKIPPGPAGNVGFYISSGGGRYLPRTVGQYIIPDNDYLSFPVSGANNNGSWAMQAYNTDVWSHLIQVTFHVNELIFSNIPVLSSPVSL